MSKSNTRSLFVSAVLTAGMLFSTLSIADDTEIFFSRTTDTGSAPANVLLMLDSSNSMQNYPVNADGLSRMEAVKQATVELVKSAKNVNIGLGSFAGIEIGGTIRYPVTDLDEDVCENLTCDSIKVHTRIENDDDDAEEAIDGSMIMDANTIQLGVGTTVGLRFNKVKIPRGATLQSARLMVFPQSSQNAPTDLVIKAENIGHSPAVTNVNHNLTSRTMTTAQVNWTPEPFQFRREYTVDILPVVSEVIGRGDWCGGNALTLLIDGTGLRNVRAVEKQYGEQAVLQLAYDPASVDFNDTCITQTSSTTIASSADDAVENMVTGVVDRTTENLQTQTAAQANLIALRFTDLVIPPAANIVSAELKLQSKGFSGGQINATVYGESTGDSPIFDATTPYSISMRPSTGSSVNWQGMQQVDEGGFVRSPDLETLSAAQVGIRAIVYRSCSNPLQRLEIIYSERLMLKMLRQRS